MLHEQGFPYHCLVLFLGGGERERPRPFPSTVFPSFLPCTRPVVNRAPRRALCPVLARNIVLHRFESATGVYVVTPPFGCRSAGSATATAAILDQAYSNHSLVNKTRFPMPSWSKRRCRAYGGGNSGGSGMSLVTVECAGHGSCNDDGSCTCITGFTGTSASSRGRRGT